MKRIYLVLLLCLFAACSQKTGDMDEYNGCSLEGDAKREDVRELNTQKNRYDFPDSAAIDRSITLQAMLAQGDDRNRFKAGTAAEITGYVIDVKVGGDESCNCHARSPQDRDTHIELALTPEASETERVIVEVTPRLRAIMSQKGIDWSTDNVRNAFKGQMVKVKGWLLFDEEHSKQAENTDPDNPKDWRATCWELHPITDIKIATGRPL